MDWLKIVSAIVLVAMFFYILPSAKNMLKNAPRGSGSDWMSFAVPVVLVVLFIIVLINMVQA